MHLLWKFQNRIDIYLKASNIFRMKNYTSCGALRSWESIICWRRETDPVGCHFVRSICNDVTGKYDIPLTLWNLASSIFRTPCAMCHLLLYSWIVFSAGGSSDRLPFLLNQSPMSASLWLALTWNWKFCNNCRKLLILKNCRIPHYVILLLPTTLECNGTNQSDNCWLTNSE